MEHMQSPSQMSVIRLPEELQITLAERAAVVVSGGLDALYCLPLEIL